MTPTINAFSAVVNSASKMSETQLQAVTTLGGFTAAVVGAQAALALLAPLNLSKGPLSFATLLRGGLPALATYVGYQVTSWLSEQPGFKVDPEQIKTGMKAGPLDFADFERARRAQDEFRRDPESARGRAFQKVTGGPIEAEVKGPVTAELKGSAAITSTITISPSPLFFAHVTQYLEASGHLQKAAGNEVGSTGKSQADTGDRK